MKRITLDPSTVEGAWVAFQKCIGGLAPIRTSAQYERNVAVMNQLIDIVGSREHHPLADLLELVGNLVADYESRDVPIPDAEPRDVLRFLMDSNNLTQIDLREEFGGQSVVSAVLGGKRLINARQARVLADRFNVSPAVFVS